MATTKYNQPKPNPNPLGKTGEEPGGCETLADQKCMVVGNIAANQPPGVKTTGIKMRGAGAATKGVMSRGPMA